MVTATSARRRRSIGQVASISSNPVAKRTRDGFWHDGSRRSLFFLEEEFFGDLESVVEAFFSEPFDSEDEFEELFSATAFLFRRTGSLIVGLIKAGALENQSGPKSHKSFGFAFFAFRAGFDGGIIH